MAGPGRRRVAEQVGAAEDEPVGVHAAGLLDESGDGQGGEGLARPRLADDAQRLAGADPEGHPTHRADRPVRAGEADAETADVEHQVGVAGRVVGALRRGRARPLHVRDRVRETRGRRDTHGAGDRLTGEVERESGDDHRDARGERGERVDVDPGEALLHEPSPVVRRLLDAQPQEGQPGEAEQHPSGADRDVDDQRLRDVGQDVPHQDAQPTHAGDPRSGHVVAFGDPGDERLAEPGEGRRSGETDGEHGTRRAHTEDHGQEEHEQQAGEGDQDVDRRRHHPSRPAAEEQRGSAEDQAHQDAEGGRQQREGHREPGGHQDPEEDVAAQAVRAEPVVGGRAGEQVVGVDGVRPVTPQDRGDDGKDEDEGQQAEPGHADGGPEDTEPAPHHESPIVERGSRRARATSTRVFTTSTQTPYTRTAPCTTG